MDAHTKIILWMEIIDNSRHMYQYNQEKFKNNKFFVLFFYDEKTSSK